MKAVYAVLSMMLAASLAWAGSGGEVGICDRCEVQELYQGIRPERVSQYDDMRYDNELEQHQGQNPGSERDDMRSDVELGIAPSRSDVEAQYECETGIAPSGRGWGELGIAPSRNDVEAEQLYPQLGIAPRHSDVEQEARYRFETGIAPSDRGSGELGIAPSRNDVEAEQLYPELGIAPKNSDVEAEKNAPARYYESHTEVIRSGQPPTSPFVSPTGQNDHFPPPSTQVLPPLVLDGSEYPNEFKLEFPPVVSDGSNDPSLWAVETPAVESDGSEYPNEFTWELPPVESDGGQLNPKAEWPHAIAW